MFNETLCIFELCLKEKIIAKINAQNISAFKQILF